MAVRPLLYQVFGSDPEFRKWVHKVSDPLLPRAARQLDTAICEQSETRLMKSKRFLIITGAILLALPCYATVSLGQARSGATRQSDESARAESAATVLSEIMEAPDQ